VIPADAPFISRPASNFMAGVLALGVHGAFLLLLVFGVSWQTQHPAPVMVDLWEALPAEPASSRRPPPIKKVEPVKRMAEPAPSRRPVVKEPPTPKAPDIALEKKKADAKRMAEEKLLTEAARIEAETARKAHEKQLADQKTRELLRQMEAEELRQRMAEESAANEARLAKLAEAQAAAGRRQTELTRTVGQYRDKISATVRGNTRLPDNLQGNPEVRCLVRLLPTGEVLGVRVTQASGNAAYDEAVVRAIQLSSPLPLPADREARAAFVPELLFVHRPK
jgi:colicin import membrane protein